MSSQPTRLVRWLLLSCVLVVCVWVRCGDRAHLVRRDGLLIYDLDTLRRIARLTALDQATTYPLVERHDGCPDGTVLHWTLPMDMVIRALDPLARPWFASARPYEAGAVVAGPTLAALAIAVFTLLLVRVLGFWPALVAGALYGGSYSCVNTSRLGNGDHQTLQQLLLALALPGLLRALARVGARASAWAFGSGAAVGSAVWVSTEMMLVFYLLALALGALALWPQAEVGARAHVRRLSRPWSAGVLLCACVGHAVEHRGHFAAFAWDAVSWFQIWQVATFALFACLVARLAESGNRQVTIAAGAALLVGLSPLLFGAVRTALAAQLHAAGEVNVWLKAEVSEFRSVFQHGYGALFEREGLTVLALPFALLLSWRSSLPRAAQVWCAVLGLGTAALYVWEVKLGHLFGLAFPLILVTGFAGVQRIVPALSGASTARVAAAAALANVLWCLPGERAPMLRHNDLVVRDICRKLQDARARLPADQQADAGVLAPWDFGAPLMYHAGVGVVASGYHRNLAGIHDGFRFWFSDVAEQAQAMQLLHRRRVRFVVAWYDRTFLRSGARVLGRAPLLTEREILPAAARTMFWRLRYATVPGFRQIAAGPEIQLPGNPKPEPIYRLFEVVGN